MVIKIVNGDLLEAKENLILHQVNCKGVMGSGVAKQVKEKWNNVYLNYHNLCKNYGDKLLGYVQFVHIEKGQHIVNIFSQLDYGTHKRQTNYEALYNALHEVSTTAKVEGFTVALPYNMGCDRGGASWHVVYAMIEDVFKDVDVTIYKYEGEK